MRTVHDPQMKFGEVDIAAIELDPKSRDDIPPILSGLQYIYSTVELRSAVLQDSGTGHPLQELSGTYQRAKTSKSGQPSWASRDGAVEDPGSRHVAPEPQHRL